MKLPLEIFPKGWPGSFIWSWLMVRRVVLCTFFLLSLVAFTLLVAAFIIPLDHVAEVDVVRVWAVLFAFSAMACGVASLYVPRW